MQKFLKDFSAPDDCDGAWLLRKSNLDVLCQSVIPKGFLTPLGRVGRGKIFLRFNFFGLFGLRLTKFGRKLRLRNLFSSKRQSHTGDFIFIPGPSSSGRWPPKTSKSSKPSISWPPPLGHSLMLYELGAFKINLNIMASYFQLTYWYFKSNLFWHCVLFLILDILELIELKIIFWSFWTFSLA